MSLPFSPDPQTHSQMVAEQAIMQDPALFTNMNANLGWFYDDAQRQMLMDSKMRAQEFNLQAYRLQTEWENLHAPWFQRFHANGRESVKYVTNEQWNDRDRLAHAQQGRRAYEMDIISPYYHTLMGEYIGARGDWQATPFVEPTSNRQQIADIYNHYLKWVQQSGDNQWDAADAMCASDALIRGVCVAGIRPDPFNPMASVALEHMFPYEFMWDIGSTKNPFLDGTRFLSRRYWKDRVELSWMFPEWAKEILAMMPGSINGGNANDLMMETQMRARAGASANDGGMPIEFNQFFSAINRGPLLVKEFYERRRERKYFVRDGTAGKTYYFDTPGDATKARGQLEMYYTQDPVAQQLGAAILSNVNPQDVSVVDQYISIGNLLLRVQSEVTERFPYEVMIPEWIEGSVTSFVERGKSRQRFINRLFSNIDIVIGALKPQGVIDKHYLSSKMTDEEILQGTTQSGKVWVVDSNGDERFDPARVLHTTSAPNPGPAIMPTYNLIQDNIRAFYGGSTVLGQAEYAGQSGTSQQGLRAMASTQTMPFFDMMKHFNRRVGEQVIQKAQYLDPATKMEIVDEAGDPFIASFAQAGIQSFNDIRFNIQVTERSVSPSEQSRRYGLFIGLMGQMPNYAQAFMPLVLQYMDVPFKDKQSVIQAIQGIDQQNAQLQEREQSLAEQMQDRSMRVKESGQMLKAAMFDLQRERPFVITSSLKIPATPALIADIMTGAGSPATPAAVIADQSQKILLDQGARNLAQISEQELWTPEQKKLQEAKAAQIKHAASQKDAVARSQKSTENTG